jgi:hypothetical protein
MKILRSIPPGFLAGVATTSLLLAGCASPTGSAAKVTSWNPLTWFSGSAGREAGRADERQARAEAQVIDAAQRTAHETLEALSAAPASRPVEIARESAGVTVTLLDQAAGPLTADESAAIREQIRKLLSDNEALRRQGEKIREENRETVGALSEKLAKAEAGREAATKDLQAAFARENELANTLRNQRFILWATVIIAAIGYLGVLYLRFAYGGIPNAIGRGLAELRAKNPGAAGIATEVFDSFLNRDEQRKISQHS